MLGQNFSRRTFLKYSTWSLLGLATVGVMGWPIRFGSRPEITVFTLRAASPRFYQEQTMTDDVAISSTLIRFNKIAPSTIKLIL